MTLLTYYERVRKDREETDKKILYVDLHGKKTYGIFFKRKVE